MNENEFGSQEDQNALPVRDRSILWASVFFVLGFSSVFSLLGILLQTILSNVSYTVVEWLARIGGVIIIVFGLFVMGVLKFSFLERERRVRVTKKFKSMYMTSFVFGAAFAVGWTPCVSAALGAILALAATHPASAFFLLMAYTLGIGIPFIIVGLFSARAQSLIDKTGEWLVYLQYIFGALLVVIGVLIFLNQLSRIANVVFLTELLIRFGVAEAGGHIMGFSIFNVVVAFVAGLGSFLSPCILPIVPGFLSYLAGTAAKK